MSEDLLNLLVKDLVRRHPMPWNVESDWMWEVYDSAGALVIKMAQQEPVRALMEMAQKVHADQEKFHADQEKFLEEWAPCRER